MRCQTGYVNFLFFFLKVFDWTKSVKKFFRKSSLLANSRRKFTQVWVNDDRMYIFG